MSSHAKPTTATVIPCLRYRNAPAMIERLCKAFGFEKHAVYADGDVVQHAQLTFGNGMIMPGSANNASEWGRHIAQPDEVGDRETQCCCIVVSDCTARYVQAKAGGAEIVDEFETRDYGDSGYGGRDPEGHLWWFGDYDPWADQPT